ncbi:MAG: hypothetical protein ACR2H1_14960, partial [Limisphaerales bacterium]
PTACILGALAAALNINFFSGVCWGQGSRPLSLAAAFLALAAITNAVGGRHSWIKICLAGLAVGWGVSEAFDVGALFSLFVGAYILFVTFLEPQPPAQKISRGISRLTLLILFSVLMAAQTIVTLMGTALQGPTGGVPEDSGAKWNFITQWSSPKIETLRVIIPGIFGYRMDSPDGGQYWGAVGQTTGVITSRHSGSGEYAGILVALLAASAIAYSFTKQNNPFSNPERKFIWFWSCLAFVSLLFSFGKYAPFYQLIYPLPFFSTMRSPMKFMHPFHLALIILFGYGLQALTRQYLETTTNKIGSLKIQFKKFTTAAFAFEKKLAIASLLLVAISLLGWLIYASSRKEVMAYLQTIGFDATQAALISGFSISEVGWFLLFLILSVGLILVNMSGWLAGPRAKWATILLGT